MRIAAVDLGTNTLLMTIADVVDTNLSVLCDMHSIVRLGENVTTTGRISEAALDRALEVLRSYASLCDDFRVDVRVGVATSAARRATNANDVLNACSAVYGGSIHKISGEEEAELTYGGSVPNDADAVVLDIGGGSTEIVSGNRGRVRSKVSMEIGAVTLHEKFLRNEPVQANDIKDAREMIRSVLCDTPMVRGDWYGVAGTPTTLALMAQNVEYTDVKAAHDYLLTHETVREISHMLLVRSTSEICALRGVHPQRADILSAGALILDEVMHFHNCAALRVSTRGLRYGVLLQAVDAVGKRTNVTKDTNLS